MNPTTLNELPPLPVPVAALLDSLHAVETGVRVRVFAARGEKRVCLYPPQGAGRWSAVDGATIELPEGGAVELESSAASPVLHLLAHTLEMSLDYEREARSAARELTERYEEINLLYFISEVLASVLSVPEAATSILEEVADTLGARRASLWVYDEADNSLHLAAAVGEDGLRGPIAADDPDSATAKVFRDKEALNLERGAVLTGLPRLEPRPQGREAFLSVPINYTPPNGSARTVGVITLVGRRTNVRFSAGDARLLTAIASQVGAALETQRLVRESLRQERMMREIELAHDLQLKLLPDPSSFEAPHEISARCVPADSVGGDFYQIFRLSHDRLGLMIGDVSSHGFPAALIMALTMSAVGIYAPESGSPAEVLKRVHRAIEKELTSTEMYMTLFYGVLDPSAGSIVYANAGHPHAYRVCADGSRQRLGATGLPLGIIDNDDYGEAEAEWRDGEDLMLLFTDGLSDACKGGEEALVDEVCKLHEKPLPQIIDRIFRMTARTRVNTPGDDRTALLVRR